MHRITSFFTRKCTPPVDKTAILFRSIRAKRTRCPYNSIVMMYLFYYAYYLFLLFYSQRFFLLLGRYGIVMGSSRVARFLKIAEPSNTQNDGFVNFCSYPQFIWNKSLDTFSTVHCTITSLLDLCIYASIIMWCASN